MRFRVLSYNIHKCIGGLDRRYRPERVADTIAHYEADFVLLQEVDNGVPRSQMHRQVDWLGDALDYPHRAFQSNVTLRTGSYGNAVLSRVPLEEVTDVDLTIPLKKRRQGLVVRASLHDREHRRTVVIANVHLGLAGFERVIQLRRLLADHSIAHLRHATPLVVAGDFNDVWGTLGQRTLIPHGFAAALGDVRTFPAALPVRPLDRVYFRGELRLCSGFAGHLKVSRQASDHLPVIADFEIRSPR